MNKTALITGASIGIGYEFAKIFAKNNYDLVLVARSTDKLNQLAKELSNVKVLVITKDLSIPGSGKEIYDELKQKNIQVDVLVNNAGFGDFGFFHKAKIEKQLQMIDLNVRSLTELTHLFGSLMVARKEGKIINVASIASFQPGPMFSVYYATKHYVLALSEGLANEWKDFGVTVSALCPGPTESGFMAASGIRESKLAKRFKMPSSYEVALYGYESLMNGKTVAVHGMMNKILAQTSRFFPRKVVTGIVRKVQDRISE